MKNSKIAEFLSILVLFFTCGGLSFALSVPAQAQSTEIWKGACVRDVDVATIQGFECLFANIVRVITPIAFLLLFITLIAGAFQYLTSGGDPKQTQKASKAITSAIIGIVLFLGIWFILQLIKIITGIDVTIFRIPG